MTDSFTFSLSPLDTEALLPQLAAALEKRVELHSRQRLPACGKLPTSSRTQSVALSLWQTIANICASFWGLYSGCWAY